MTPHASFLRETPKALRFGTSGLRGLVSEMTDLEIYINTTGFIDYLRTIGDLSAGRLAIAQDLRRKDPRSGLSSSPRIARAVGRAAADAGLSVVDCGQVPTPALALYAATCGPMPCVMVTGSHIPADRNGIKFYKSAGEVLKSDEARILAAIAATRTVEYGRSGADTQFDEEGMFRQPLDKDSTLQSDEAAAQSLYLARYVDLFAGRRPLHGLEVVVYQHSAVGRDLLVTLLEALGAHVIAEGRSEQFVSVDTEDVTDDDLRYYAELIERHRPDAIVSTDGDSDRPLLIDERGCFHRGDVLGVITAEYLGARFAAVPLSTSDALDIRAAAMPDDRRTVIEKTRIGSPHVIAAMQRAAAAGQQGIVAWEANGGFLTGSDFAIGGRQLAALPTRDAALPIIAALHSAKRAGLRLSELFAALPPRATGAGLIDDFPRAVSEAIVARLSPSADVLSGLREVCFSPGESPTVQLGQQPTSSQTVEPTSAGGEALVACRREIERAFERLGCGAVVRINYLDGVRVWFDSGEIVHLRPSGNAPQLRLYVITQTAQRTASIVAEAIAEPNGLLRQLEREASGSIQ